jgi:endogenous inhibitor of DNA gyrase (YacG/DUF329 family)
VKKAPSQERCPICRKATVVDYRPFCSKRCANVDLGRWLGGTYTIPAEEPLGEADLDAIISNDNATEI